MNSAPLCLCAILFFFAAFSAFAEQDRELVSVEPTLVWHDNPTRAYAESEETGKPVLLVFR